MSNVTMSGAIPWDAWLKLNNISRGYGYKLLRDGHGPRLILIGTKKYVSPAANADWHAAEEERALSVEALAEAEARRALFTSYGKEAAKSPRHPSQTRQGPRKLKRKERAK
jgi:hypothetical protein